MAALLVQRPLPEAQVLTRFQGTLKHLMNDKRYHLTQPNFAEPTGTVIPNDDLRLKVSTAITCIEKERDQPVTSKEEYVAYDG